MTKRMTFDGSGDSDDLQALFDSIAGTDAAEKPKLEVVEPKAAAPGGDSDELQDLFDAVANEFEGDEPEAAAAVADPEADPRRWTRQWKSTRWWPRPKPRRTTAATWSISASAR